MSDSPYVPFYTSDFLAGTSGMTAAAKGVYITLLCLMYEAEGPLTQKFDTLARRCGCTLPAFKRAISDLQDDGKIDVTDAGLWSSKCDKHITQRRERSDSAKAAAKKRWEKSEQKQRKADAKASSAQCQPEPEPLNTIANAIDGGAVDATEVLWSKCKDWLVSQGVKDGQARSVIGKWLKGSNPAEVRAAFVEAFHAKTGDPIPYITKILSKPSTQPDLDQLLSDVSFGGH